jgi:hypothetical protein
VGIKGHQGPLRRACSTTKYVGIRAFEAVRGGLPWAATPASAIEAPEPVPPSGRISVRLPNDDLLLLRERAAARGLPAATYVSYLVRSHLRRLAPLPDAELKALKHAIGEISAIGRNLNQIARAVNSGKGANGPNSADLHALLRACTGLRDAVKDVVNRNLSTWEAGYEKTSS